MVSFTASRKGVITPHGVTAKSSLLYTLCDSVAAVGDALKFGVKQLATGVLIFCGLKPVGYGALAEARWQAPGERVDYLNAIVYAAFFRFIITGLADVFARPMLNLLGYLGAFVVVAGAMYSAIGHHRLWVVRKREAVVPLPRSGE